MNSAEFNDARKSFARSLLPAIGGVLIGLPVLLSVLIPEKPHPNRPFAILLPGVLVALVALAFSFYWFRKSYLQLRRLECPSCQELMTRHVEVILRTGRCPVCGQQILSDVHDETFLPARSQWPQMQEQSVGSVRRQKVLANILIVIGLITMACGLAFISENDIAHAVPVFAGAIVGIIGVFVRGRVRQRIPLLAVTDMDKNEFQKLRREFNPRNLLAKFLGNFGAFILFVGVCSPFYTDAGKSQWHAAIILLPVGGLFVYCAKLLYKKPG